MNADLLRALQTPVKERYKQDPASAVVTMQATGTLDVQNLTCNVETFAGTARSALHQAAGGVGPSPCSGDMLLEALVACAGVTLSAVATALSIAVRGGTIMAEGEVDFRGTLGVSKDAPIGFKTIRLKFDLDTDAGQEQVAKLINLTERYCVIYQTLVRPPEISTGH